jgi:hypothetical protein
VALPAGEVAVVGTVALDDDEVPQAASAVAPRIPAIPREIRRRKATPVRGVEVVLMIDFGHEDS